MGGLSPSSPPGSNFSLSDECTKVAMDVSSTGPPAPPTGSDLALCDEFAKVAIEPGTGPSWSDLLVDILLTILQHLELPQAIAFASVCKTWRSAATVARVPCSCTPWIISWANHLEKRRVQGKCSTFVTCSSYHLDVEKAYDISFPQGCFVACCGASHGWLVLVNELSNLVLYNPFTTAMIPLPPITDFECVEAVYGSGGQDKWQVASTFPGRLADRYLDCAYHDGSFYTVTSYGLLEKWHLDELGLWNS
ncbi:hypothetical protein QOZ80_4BG0338080 [Eleusine coracana subsp. coracana]|nr:hypothetical protein QOZ80_4BG0338080 [Eleusine coracana subsp. coracana]